MRSMLALLLSIIIVIPALSKEPMTGITYRRLGLIQLYSLGCPFLRNNFNRMIPLREHIAGCFPCKSFDELDKKIDAYMYTLMRTGIPIDCSKALPLFGPNGIIIKNAIEPVPEQLHQNIREELSEARHFLQETTKLP